MLSELGFDLSKFPTERHFTSWLRLSPNRRGSARPAPAAPKAVVATARKIVERFYRLLTKGGDYVRQQMNAYEQSYQLKLTRSLAIGYRLVPVALAQ